MVAVATTTGSFSLNSAFCARQCPFIRSPRCPVQRCCLSFSSSCLSVAFSVCCPLLPPGPFIVQCLSSGTPRHGLFVFWRCNEDGVLFLTLSRLVAHHRGLSPFLCFCLSACCDVRYYNLLMMPPSCSLSPALPLVQCTFSAPKHGC